MAYFSLTWPVPAGEEINFVPGDVVGWFIFTRFMTTLKPLSVLFITSAASAVAERGSSGAGGEEVDLYTLYQDREPCEVCGVVSEGLGTGSDEDVMWITSVMPLISVSYGESYFVTLY